MKPIKFELILIWLQYELWFNVEFIQCNSLFRNDIESALTQNGCHNFDEALPLTAKVVACKGLWSGNIENAGRLCANGFTLCTWEDAKYLKEIRRSLATQLDGCFAYNAAQDGDQCLPCKHDSSNNTLTGVGNGCHHLSLKRSNCLNGEGRIDASCRNDTMHNKGCSYVPGITTGVVCCRRDDIADNIQMDGPATEASPSLVVNLSYTVGEKIMMTCPVVGELNKEKISWSKNGETVVDNRFSSRLLFKMARQSDSGFYVCRINNSNSINESRINLTVHSVESKGCADGTSEGLHTVDRVRGCAGSWIGHVKRAERRLCGKGWKICSPKDRPLLQKIDVKYLHAFGGCFAYNAAHVNQKCRRCQNKHSMAALGSDCAVNEKISNRMSRNRSLCYSNRVIQAYTDKFVSENGNGCFYRREGGIDGVLCCQKRKFKSDKSVSNRGDRSSCVPNCANGKICVDGKCICPDGECDSIACVPRCINGGKCISGICSCHFPYHGSYCQHNLPRSLNDGPALNENQLEFA